MKVACSDQGFDHGTTFKDDDGNEYVSCGFSVASGRDTFIDLCPVGGDWMKDAFRCIFLVAGKGQAHMFDDADFYTV